MTEKNVLCRATIVANDGREYPIIKGTQLDDAQPVFLCYGYDENGNIDRCTFAVVKGLEVIYNAYSRDIAKKEVSRALYGSDVISEWIKILKNTNCKITYVPVSTIDGEKEGQELTDLQLKRRDFENGQRAEYRAKIKTAQEELQAWKEFQFYTKKDGKPFAVVSKNYDTRRLNFGSYSQAWFRYNPRTLDDGRTIYDTTKDFYCKTPETFDELKQVIEKRKEELQNTIETYGARLESLDAECTNIIALFAPVAEALKNAVCASDVKKQLKNIYGFEYYND